MGGDLKQGTKNMKKNGGNNNKNDDDDDSRQQVQWVFMEGENDNISDSDSLQSAGSNEEEEEVSSRNSEASSSPSSSFSSDLVEDALSPSPSPSPSSYEPLYELSELMNQLPIKRGLSKFYQGKSQSFTSLAKVSSLEDLAKKVRVSPYNNQRMKSCKSYAGFDGHKFGPKATITKKSSRPSFLSSVGIRGNFS